MDGLILEDDLMIQDYLKMKTIKKEENLNMKTTLAKKMMAN